MEIFVADVLRARISRYANVHPVIRTMNPYKSMPRVETVQTNRRKRSRELLSIRDVRRYEFAKILFGNYLAHDKIYGDPKDV
jgi:hypothetical protein